MKTHSIVTYSITELKNNFPDGFKRALSHWQNKQCYDDGIPWAEETVDSLKALISAAGLALRDWSLGAYSRNNYIRIDFRDYQEISGPRAMAWLENNLLGSLRIPWSGKGRDEIRKYGKLYRPGLIRPCPFTGYCADESFLNALVKSIRGGDTIKEAFTSLADVCQDLLEQEADAQQSEEYFVDHAEGNDWQFTEDGELF